MTQYRLLRAEHETQRARPSGWSDTRYALVLILCLVCLSCIYWIRFTDREICVIGVGHTINESLVTSLETEAVVAATSSANPSSVTKAQRTQSYETTNPGPMTEALVTRATLNESELYQNFILFTNKCHLKYYDYKDPEVTKQYYSRAPTKCSKDIKPFIFYAKLNLTGGYSCVGVNETLYKTHYAKTFQLSNCSYKEPVRSLDHIKIDYYHEFRELKPLKVDSCPSEEFLWIQCGSLNSNDTYEQPLFLPLVKPAPQVLRENNRGQKPLHVLVVGLDSVSRLNAHRQFPTTMAFLQKKKNLVELFGYNKIGLNSAPNQIPLITGIPFRSPGLLERASKTHFDNLTRFLWDDFGSRGFRSMFYEEQWIYGLFLYPPLSGFHNAPTTYWPRPLMQAIDKSTLKKDGCVGPDQPAKIYLDYTFDTFRILGNQRPLFSYSWLSEAAHDNINGGQLIDEYFLDFFTKMDSSGVLNDTAVFFISDHGMRFGSFRSTPQGRLEDMLPYGFILMPDRFHEAYPDAKRIMDINSRRLLTTIDLHASLLELADVWDEDRVIRTANGHSIFSSVIPFDRTCADAGIDIQFCSCYESHPQNSSSVLAWSMGEHVVRSLNLKLEEANATHCSEYKLKKIPEFIRLSEGNSWTDFYKISLETEPHAQFEVTSRASFKPQATWEIISDFDRIDQYSPHSQCVKGLPIEKYCYCK